MQFFEEQAKSKTRSLLFYALFFFSVGLFAFLLYILVTMLLWKGGLSSFKLSFSPLLILVIVGPILTASLWKISKLNKEGGHMVMDRMNANHVESFSECLLERRLRNVIEEMAIASGLPKPAIYVLDEIRINAITVGMKPDEICMGVSRGALENLNRSELQAVVAHEFSHLLNGDVRFKTSMVGWLHGISFVHQLGEKMMNGGFNCISSRSVGHNDTSMAIYVGGLILMTFGYIGYIQALWIKSLFCRQREHLADAYAVQFSRNPESLGNALKKARNNSAVSMLVGPDNEFAHLFFAKPCPIALSMHPAIDDRLDVIYEGLPGRHSTPNIVTPETEQEKKLSHHIPEAAPRSNISSTIEVTSAAAMMARLSDQQQQAANQDSGNFAFPLGFNFQMPIDVDSARAALLSVLGDSASYGEHIDQLKVRFDAAYQASEPLRKIRLIEQAATKLSELSPAEFKPFEDKVLQLIHADNHIDLFEFMVLMTIRKHTRGYYADVEPIAETFPHIGDLKWEATLLLSAVAVSGSGSSEELAEQAFRRGAGELELELGATIKRLPQSECHWQNIEMAVGKFLESSDAAKAGLIRSLSAVALADQKIEDDELHLIQGICAAIDAPLPELMVVR